MASDQPTLFDCAPPTSKKKQRKPLTAEQKAAQIEATRRWRLRNPEAVAAANESRNAQRREPTPEEKKRSAVMARAWDAANREKINADRRERDRRLKEANPDAVKRLNREKQRKRYAKPVKRAMDAGRQRTRYATDVAYQFKVREAVNRRRMRLAKDGRVTPEQWQGMITYYGNCCAYCGRSDLPLAMDHVEALSRGGLHTPYNLAPACKPCNSSKRDATLVEFLFLRELAA